MKSETQGANAASATPKKAWHRRLLACGLSVAAVAAMSFALAACQPQAASESDAGEGSESDVITMTTVEDFMASDTGPFPDTYQNQLQNTGNRGCNTCHEDLFDVLQTTNPKHILDYVGYGKAVTWADCQPCHDFRWGRAGAYMGDYIHSSHYANEVFVDEDNGNCWSCHATVNGEGKEVTWELWDEVKYDALYAGYDEPAEVESTYWVQSRGIADSGYLSGVEVAANPEITVDFSQPITDEADVMQINNWQSIDINGTQWYLDDYDYSDWALQVTGVNNPRSFTIDDLRAMEQTEIVATQCCETSGLGCVTVNNSPYSGVLISDIIEACGGLSGEVEDCQVYPVAADTWTGEGYDGMSLSTLLNANAIIALDMYGHELTDDQGAPALLVVPGTPGAAWVKHITSIDFRTMDDPADVFNPYDVNKSLDGIYPVNSGFFQEDGVEFALGDAIQLSGYSFSWDSSMGAITKVSFSVDYGETWVDCTPSSDLDPTQWTYWDFSWTPDKAGTYIVKVQAESADGSVQVAPANVIVKVTE